MIRRKQSLVRGSPHRLSGGGDPLHGIPAHNLSTSDRGLLPLSSFPAAGPLKPTTVTAGQVLAAPYSLFCFPHPNPTVGFGWVQEGRGD